uniref:Uncharacterized protein n=1 Tax=Cacopsylla melanoneura TaxID=428564 RepID=A0A8D9BHX7_9HEMI
MMSRLTSLKAQTKKIKISLQKFKNEKYIILKPEIYKIEEEYKNDKLENITAQLCENWMDALEDLEQLKEKYEIAETSLQELDAEKTGLKAQISNYDDRIKTLIEENNEQLQDMDKELKENKDTVCMLNNKINKLEKQIITNSNQENELNKKIAYLQKMNSEKYEILTKMKDETEKYKTMNAEVIEENKNLKILMEKMAKIIETEKNSTPKNQVTLELDDSNIMESSLDFTKNGNNLTLANTFNLTNSLMEITLQDELNQDRQHQKEKAQQLWKETKPNKNPSLTSSPNNISTTPEKIQENPKTASEEQPNEETFSISPIKHITEQTEGETSNGHHQSYNMQDLNTTVINLTESKFTENNTTTTSTTTTNTTTQNSILDNSDNTINTSILLNYSTETESELSFVSATNEKNDEEGTLEGRNGEEGEEQDDKQPNKGNEETLDDKQNLQKDMEKEGTKREHDSKNIKGKEHEKPEKTMTINKQEDKDKQDDNKNKPINTTEKDGIAESHNPLEHVAADTNEDLKTQLNRTQIPVQLNQYKDEDNNNEKSVRTTGEPNGEVDTNKNTENLLSPEISVYIPKNLKISPTISKYKNHNIRVQTMTKFEYEITLKLEEVLYDIKVNKEKINGLEKFTQCKNEQQKNRKTQIDTKEDNDDILGILCDEILLCKETLSSFGNQIHELEILTQENRRKLESHMKTIPMTQTLEEKQNYNIGTYKSTHLEQGKNMSETEKRNNKVREPESKENHTGNRNKEDRRSKTQPKKVCYFYGDSHLRYLRNILDKKEDFTNQYEIQIQVNPGRGIEYIYNQINQQIKPNNVLVISAGTNDLYKTKFHNIKNTLEEMSTLEQRIILITIPPQKDPYVNEDIMKLNNKIQNLVNDIPNIETLNINQFVKPKHLALDGIHLSRRAKEWLCDRIVDKIQTSTTTNQYEQETTTDNTEPREHHYHRADNERQQWHQQKNQQQQHQLQQPLQQQNQHQHRQHQQQRLHQQQQHQQQWQQQQQYQQQQQWQQQPQQQQHHQQ